MGKVGLEPTTAEATDLQSAAIPITLYLPIVGGIGAAAPIV